MRGHSGLLGEVDQVPFARGVPGDDVEIVRAAGIRGRDFERDYQLRVAVEVEIDRRGSVGSRLGHCCIEQCVERSPDGFHGLPFYAASTPCEMPTRCPVARPLKPSTCT